MVTVPKLIRELRGERERYAILGQREVFRRFRVGRLM
jgi:hypothetical protein